MAADEVPALRQILGLPSAGSEAADAGPTSYIKDRVLATLEELFRKKQVFTWRSTEEETGLLLSDVYAYNLTEVEPKPAVVVRRGQVSWRNLGIGQLREHWGPGDQPVYSDILRSEITCYCLARMGLVAEALSDSVFLGLSYFKQEIEREMKVHDISNLVIGEEVLAKSDSGADLSVVPVFSTWEIEKTWAVLETDAPPLRNIEITIGVDP